ncbi:ComEC/Rec2 family competence protein [Sphingobacterium sp. LRF_L2]|uniref:ComEC/Rec2 family competence protein n=1 Tax=Sphingobacterium sp. LRF_L2 TaxID=3369421 RepID=UPI003F5F24D0
MTTFLYYFCGLIVLLAVCSSIVLTLFYKRLFKCLFPWLFSVALFLLGIVVIKQQQPHQQLTYFKNQDADTLIGVIVEEPVYKEKNVRFVVRVEGCLKHNISIPATGNVMLSVKSDQTDHRLFSYGDKLLFANRVAEVSKSYNPLQFDYREYLKRKNIDHQAYLTMGQLTKIDSNKASVIRKYTLNLRMAMLKKFQHVISDQRALDICAALVFGYRTNFDETTLAAFTNTGTVHILSVSGLHVGIVFYILNFLLRPVDRIKFGQHIRLSAILILIWMYVLLTGCAPSILRAGVMITFLLFANWGRRKSENVNTLFASASILLILDPFLLFDVGFQLSYLAVLGLFVFHPLLLKCFPTKRKFVKPISELLSVSCSAQLFTSPLAIFYFHQFPTYFLIANLFITIPSTLLMYVGLLLMLSPWNFLNIFLGRGLVFLSHVTLEGLEWIQKMPASVLSGLQLSSFELIVCFLLIFFLTISWYSALKKFLWIVVSLGMILVGGLAVKSIAYSGFQGIKVYNMKHQLAIAVIDRGVVCLFSNLDSLDHPLLKNAVLLDLSCYTDIHGIKFECLFFAEGKEILLETAFGRLAIIEGERSVPLPTNCQWILWRNAGKDNLLNFEESSSSANFIWDGVDRETVFSERQNKFHVLGKTHYVLKNNFAYVWQKED